MSVVDRIIDRIAHRAPDLEIGGAADPYLRRWFVIPRNRWFNIYLHHIRKSDDDRALHDHPWVNCSIILRGAYIEVIPSESAPDGVLRDTGSIVFRRPTSRHRLLILPHWSPVWTLFITGPRIREWGFHCPKGWVHWKDFTAGPNGETVGKGCGE